MKPQRIPRKQKGAALVVGMVLLLVLTLLAVSGMNTASTELIMAGNEQYQENAFQAAEIGIEQAMALIRVLAQDQPDELARAYQEASDRGEQWRRALTRGVRRMTPDTQDMLSQALVEA